MSATISKHAFSLLTLSTLVIGLSLSVQSGWSADPPITAIAFAPDGNSVLVGSQRGIVEYDWPDLNPSRTIACEVGNLHALAFSPDGKSLGIAGGTPAEEGIVEIVAWPEMDRRKRIGDHSDSVMAITWVDKFRIASASLDHQILICSIASESPPIRVSGHSKGVTALCVIQASNQLVSAGIDQNLRIWDLGSRELIRSMNNHTLPVHSLALRPGDHPLAMVASVSEDKTVRLWQPSIGRMVRFVRLTSAALDVVWLMDGSAIVVACEDGRIRLIDPDTVEVTREFLALDGWAYSLAVHPRDHSLLVGGADGQLKRIDLPPRDSSQ